MAEISHGILLSSCSCIALVCFWWTHEPSSFFSRSSKYLKLVARLVWISSSDGLIHSRSSGSSVPFNSIVVVYLVASYCKILYVSKNRSYNLSQSDWLTKCVITHTYCLTGNEGEYFLSSWNRKFPWIFFTTKIENYVLNQCEP